MTEFLKEINWSPLWISLKTGLVATVIAFFLGVFCARKIMKLKPGARAVLDLYPSPGTSAYSGRIFSASDFQPEKTPWKFSSGQF